MLKRYLVLHEGRKGLSISKFQSGRDLTKLKVLGLTVEEDIGKDLRDLLLFLGIAVEWNDYVIIREDPPLLGEW